MWKYVRECLGLFRMSAGNCLCQNESGVFFAGRVEHLYCTRPHTTSHRPQHIHKSHTNELQACASDMRIGNEYFRKSTQHETCVCSAIMGFRCFSGTEKVQWLFNLYHRTIRKSLLIHKYVQDYVQQHALVRFKRTSGKPTKLYDCVGPMELVVDCGYLNTRKEMTSPWFNYACSDEIRTNI